MSNEKKTGKGARTEGAKTKGKAAALHNLAIDYGGKGKLKANPYSDARPGMRDAWGEAYDAAYAAGVDEREPPLPPIPSIEQQEEDEAYRPLDTFDADD